MPRRALSAGCTAAKAIGAVIVTAERARERTAAPERLANAHCIPTWLSAKTCRCQCAMISPLYAAVSSAVRAHLGRMQPVPDLVVFPEASIRLDVLPRAPHPPR